MLSTDRNIQSIVEQYTEQLYWHIRRLVVSHEDAEDVLQETFIRVFRNLWQLRDRSALRPWLYRIATNEVNRFFAKRRIEDPLDEVLAAKLEAAEHVNLDEAAGMKLQKALLTLSPLQRTVFCLRYYDDMDYSQMAYVTGSKPETLKVVWHNARKKVENYLKDEE